MALHLRPFPAGSADVVSRWAKIAEEVLMWCGHPDAPVPAEQISAWANEDGVEQFGLYRDQRLVGYGELWTDDAEEEVELARLIVDPNERGLGLGQRLVTGLADLARARYPRVFLRIHPSNIAAQRCYTAAGFTPSNRIRRPSGTSASRSPTSGSALACSASRPAGHRRPGWACRNATIHHHAPRRGPQPYCGQGPACREGRC
jgi:[ribosomal protein S18]-alanine N-acetyltransferase